VDQTRPKYPNEFLLAVPVRSSTGIEEALGEALAFYEAFVPASWSEPHSEVHGALHYELLGAMPAWAHVEDDNHYAYFGLDWKST
jgi:hypothetical protein